MGVREHKKKSSLKDRVSNQEEVRHGEIIEYNIHAKNGPKCKHLEPVVAV